MKRLRSYRGGYTIVETLIYLGVTSLLFASAAILISGQQARTEYNQTIREIESYITDINNDISTGYYPTTGVGCTSTGGVPTVSGGGSLGSNGGCLFLGRLLHVVPGGANEHTIDVLTIVGSRLNSAGDESVDIFDANARIFPAELRESREFSEVISFKWARFTNGGSTAAFGLTSTLQPLLAVNNSGSTVARLIAVDGTSVGGTSSGDLATIFESKGITDDPGQIEICVESNAHDAHSIITIDQSAAGGVRTTTNVGIGCP